MSAPARGPQAIVPYLAYDDAPAAIAFLCEAFGFEEVFRMPMPDGRIGHAELRYRDNVLMLASAHPEIGFTGPSKLPTLHMQIVIDVDDVDAHCERARAAGATIASEPEDKPYGDRMYQAVDPEGQRWYFSKHVRDVPLEDMGAVTPKG
jgi:PhnB protein